MKVLVTGATGFIGSHIVEGLLSKGWETRCLVRKTSRAQRLIDLGAEIVLGDLSDIDSLTNASQGVYSIIHLAAKVSDWGPWSEFEKINVTGTQNILRAALRSRIKRFIYISTVDVYNRNLFNTRIPINEDSSLVVGKEADNYSRSKMLAERVVLSTHQKEEISATVIRPATVYGPRDMTILPRFIEFLKGPYSFWIGNSNPYIGLIYVSDVADLCLKATINEIAVGKIYNAAPENGPTLREFIQVICQEFKLREPGLRLPYGLMTTLVFITEKYATLTKRKKSPWLTPYGLRFLTVNQRFDISLAKNDLDWVPTVSLQDGIMATSIWARQNIAV